MMWPRFAQGREVGLGGGVLPHVDVHRGRQHHRSGKGQVEGGEEIAGEAVGEFGKQVRGGGCDDQDVVLLGDAMCSMASSLRREQIGDHLLAGEGGEREGLNEFFGGAGHGHPHLVSLLHERAREFRGLVGGDAATHAEENFHNSTPMTDGKIRPSVLLLPTALETL